ncbi:hypothetical protein ACF1AB_19960 [Streptomyces sp. NPDC014846]|uniref:hypothetical protein n=1 Tax=unclassified Streptomyces TaxID=2593676 RepID=UPI003701201B
MAAEVPGSFAYRITHIVDREASNRGSRTVAVANADVGRIRRSDERAVERAETCDHCGARLRVVLPSFAEVRRRRRLHAGLWKGWALLTLAGLYAFVHVLRTATGTGYGPGIAFAVTVAATLFSAYRALISALLSRSDGGPDVARVDGRDRAGGRHGRTLVPDAAEEA